MIKAAIAAGIGAVLSLDRPAARRAGRLGGKPTVALGYLLFGAVLLGIGLLRRGATEMQPATADATLESEDAVAEG